MERDYSDGMPGFDLEDARRRRKEAAATSSQPLSRTSSPVSSVLMEHGRAAAAALRDAGVPAVRFAYRVKGTEKEAEGWKLAGMFGFVTTDGFLSYKPSNYIDMTAGRDALEVASQSLEVGSDGTLTRNYVAASVDGQDRPESATYDASANLSSSVLTVIDDWESGQADRGPDARIVWADFNWGVDLAGLVAKRGVRPRQMWAASLDSDTRQRWGFSPIGDGFIVFHGFGLHKTKVAISTTGRFFKHGHDKYDLEHHFGGLSNLPRRPKSLIVGSDEVVSAARATGGVDWKALEAYRDVDKGLFSVL